MNQLKPIVEALGASGAVPATQLIHAGRKGSVGRPWDGYNPLTDVAGAADAEDVVQAARRRDP